MRRAARIVKIGSVAIGGNAPVAVQSMTNTPTADREATAAQLRTLERAGCDIARIAFSTEAECALLPYFHDATSMPLIADIQFDHRVALAAIRNGADKVRINPGNIGSPDRVRAIYDAAGAAGIPVRIGVNGGSLPSALRNSDRSPSERLTQACLDARAQAHAMGFRDLVLSVKSSDPRTTVEAYTALAAACDDPLHLGVTEAGAYEEALARSCVALGSLLLRGIGDTVRVSVTGGVEEEIRAARLLLRSVGIETDCCTIVSCPTCGRTKFDLVAFARRVRERYGALRVPLRLAVMGCVVNGPGEARDADFGVTGGDGCGIVFRKGEIVARCEESDLFGVFSRAVDAYLKEEYGIE